MPYRIKESDWKLLRRKLPSWQESHIDSLVCDYATILNSDALASEKFWKLDERIRKDKRNPGVIVHGLSRSNAITTITDLLVNDVISLDDLKEFSGEVKEAALRAKKWSLLSAEGDDRHSE